MSFFGVSFIHLILDGLSFCSLVSIGCTINGVIVIRIKEYSMQHIYDLFRI